MMKSVSENERKPMSKIIPINRDIPEPSFICHYPATLIWPRFYREAQKSPDFPIDEADGLRLGWLCMTWCHYNEWKYICEHPNSSATKADLKTLKDAKAELVEGLAAFDMPLSLADISFKTMGVKCR